MPPRDASTLYRFRRLESIHCWRSETLSALEPATKHRHIPSNPSRCQGHQHWWEFQGGLAAHRLLTVGNSRDFEYKGLRNQPLRERFHILQTESSREDPDFGRHFLGIPVGEFTHKFFISQLILGEIER